MSHPAVRIGIILTVLGLATALRFPDLSERPLHADEAVQAFRFAELLEDGRYVYDPTEFHGPTLPYLTLPVALLRGERTLTELTVLTLRWVPATLGVGLVLLVLLLCGPLGSRASLFAGLMVAVSPAVAYYNRDYIHETILIFFTLVTVTAAWHFTRGRHLGWAATAGAGAGLMHASKETAILSAVAALGAFWVTRRWGPGEASPIRGRALAVAALTAIVVSVSFFSSFFSNGAGPLDSITTYASYWGRAGSATDHIQPWNFYLSRLAYTHLAPGPYWSEATVLLLGAFGAGVCLQEGRADRASRFRFGLAAYAILLAAVYSFIPYKTPWCLLEFYVPWILLAGCGASRLVDRFTRPIVRVALAAALVTGLAQLGHQATRACFRFANDPRNPYVYAQASTGVVRLASWLERLAAVDPRGRHLPIHVHAANPWPLPWYLKEFTRVGYWEEAGQVTDAAVVIVSSGLHDAMAPTFEDDFHGSHYGLHPGEVLTVYVQDDLWKRFVAAEESR